MKKYKILETLKDSVSVCLITHIDPDADALSSAVVLRDFIKKQFNVKCVDIFSECKHVSDYLQPILGNIKINKKTNKKYHTAIMMDSPNIDRLGIYSILFKGAKQKIVIDHHLTNNFCGDINIVENVSSTCEILFSILKEYNFEINKENQGKLYAGIITDTNNFAVGNVSDKTFEIAAEFSKNINREAIYYHFLSNNTLKSLNLLSLAIQNIVTFDHNQIIISHISKEEAQKYNANDDDYKGIINKLASVNPAKYICFIKPKEDYYYIELRGRRGADVSKIAKSNGGGGHKGASGFISKNSLQVIEQNILLEFRKTLTKNNGTSKSKIF